MPALQGGGSCAGGALVGGGVGEDGGQTLHRDVALAHGSQLANLTFRGKRTWMGVDVERRRCEQTVWAAGCVNAHLDGHRAGEEDGVRPSFRRQHLG